ncbi:MAG: alanine--tRNA ligase-related protein [bacterium]
MSKFNDVKKSFLDYYQSSNRDHKAIEGVGLVAQNDPSLLFVNSGMFPLVPYLSGEPHPMGKRITNVQRSIRTDIEDFEEIGDKRHTTVFNMMGNWSLGDYFKKEQINWVLDLYVTVFKLDPLRLFVSVFEGNDAAPRDEESIAYWKEAFKRYGIEAEVGNAKEDIKLNFDSEGNLKRPTINETGLFKQVKIFTYPEKKNWWKRGYAPGELGGPDSEMFFDLGKDSEDYPEDGVHINSDNGRFLEVGNSVFMQYKLDENLKWKELSQKNVDFGGGLERVMLCQLNMQDKNIVDMFEIELFTPIIQTLEELSGLKYKEIRSNPDKKEMLRAMRIVADHLRASILLMGDGVIPSNKEHGYVLRRFLRRAIRFAKTLNIDRNFTQELALKIIEAYKEDEPQLIEKRDVILSELDKEENKFRKTLDNGLKELERITNLKLKEDKKVTAEDIFRLYESFGLPVEMSIEELKLGKYELKPEDEKNITDGLGAIKKSHQDLSRSGAEKKFKGGLADTSEITTALHTTHHLLLKALQEIVSAEIHQKGSNITAERLRIDFNYGEKLTPEQLTKIEERVNEWIEKGLIVDRREMAKSEAEKIGAEMEFGGKYGETVSVYEIKDIEGRIYSREFCGGPHVKNTSDISKFGKFKILKEESSSSGIRRIKATLVK